MSTPIKVVFGCMTFGEEGKEQSRVFTTEACQEILDVFKSHGHNELDSARMYGSGTSEEMLAKLKVQDQGFKTATKCYPSARNAGAAGWSTYTHSASDIHRCIDESLKALDVDKFDLFYLHAPDRETPFAETLEAVNKEYKAGRFERFGISNYKASEVEEIVQLCRDNDWISPSVYQGLYNAITRSAEPELFPVLRKHKISYYAYNPLGGGFFVGQYKKDAAVEQGSRFDSDRWQGQAYRKRYWNDEYFAALEQIRPIAEKYQLTLAEIALRWIQHHSALKREFGDAVIIGASSTNHIDTNLIDFEKGPLDQEVLDAVDAGWKTVQPVAPAYHH